MITVNLILLWVLIVFNLILTLALARRLNNLIISSSPKNLTTLEVGKSAPAFVAETLDGQEVQLTTFTQQRKDTIFVFISPHCNPCREKFSDLERLRPHVAEAGAELILVNDASPEESSKFLDEMESVLPMISAPRSKNPFMSDFKIMGTPFYCIIDAQGIVLSTGFLDMQWNELIKERYG